MAQQIKEGHHSPLGATISRDDSEADKLNTVSKLLELGRLDTLYRDLYFQRARELMEPIMSSSLYAHVKDSFASLGSLQKQLKVAIESGEWKGSRELTERIRDIQELSKDRREWMRLREALCDGAADIPIDPFSPGLHVFVGASPEKLQGLLDQAIKILSILKRTDASREDFYARRLGNLQALRINGRTEQEEKQPTTTPAVLQQQALEALASGNLSQLDQLLQKLMEKPVSQETKQQSANIKLAEAELGEDLLYSFSEATLAGARNLGLAPVRTLSRRHWSYLIPYGWQPSFLKDEIREVSKAQLARLTYPSETDDQLKLGIEYFLLNPFITSAGTRYQACLVVEDLLLEDFVEHEPGEKLPSTGLLTALRLESRWGLTRLELENALFQYGPRILEEKLALDPEVFKLVAIPPDIYESLGPERGWGQKRIWTHFDGYRVGNGGKLNALAGGDQRFGGVHDVISFSRAYTQERILARFAVVQRRRMMPWHRD